ncbi:Fpg/Nei family DNA glycosylase [Kineosporia rhizophila]|uniref:DNA-formamidopyrimidine glycosylase family protein n=1 Tax=Kineosporia TaxID=49184 RepID=UPI000B0490BA|nr:DNA-formamidopyrimidine glycosylase family protein [Kineosporia sp. NBRC 101677]MCE0540264.1 Fpg/Nei family DNA glycosylase [Kineosporia rhizophila]GLY16274.1 putative endonuclease 8 2 [Kineosporia sp. NBRC 101677]
MPEGDVVLRTARRLDAALAGRRLVKADLRWPSLAGENLVGLEVLEVVAVGKHLLIRLEQNATLHSHLRMEGSWHVHRTGEPWRRPRAEHEIRAVLVNQEWTAIGHHLGMMDLIATDRESTLVGHLGPDILSPTWDLAVATQRVRDQGEREIGLVLLDQRVIAGIGTFFMSEAAFLRGVNPWQPTSEVAKLEELVRLAHRLMVVNVDRATQVTTGNARKGQEAYVHARSGRPCRRCGTTIRVATLGEPPNDRAVFWCPHCQPGVVPTDDGRPRRPLGAERGPVGAERRIRPPRPRSPYRR